MFDWLKKAFGDSEPERRRERKPVREFRPAKLPPRRSEQTTTASSSSGMPTSPIPVMVAGGTSGQSEARMDGPRMLKLYKVQNGQLQYHEAWCNQGVITEHWGVVGERGLTTEHIVPRGVKDGAEIRLILQSAVDSGFAPIESENHAILIIEYSVEGFGTPQDLAKRHALQDRMGEVLGWTGLGDCDGGSIGSGTMEVCCYVVDFQIAKRVIEGDLKGTEYEDYTRIYLENEVA